MTTAKHKKKKETRESQASQKKKEKKKKQVESTNFFRTACTLDGLLLFFPFFPLNPSLVVTRERSCVFRILFL